MVQKFDFVKLWNRTILLDYKLTHVLLYNWFSFISDANFGSLVGISNLETLLQFDYINTAPGILAQVEDNVRTS